MADFFGDDEIVAQDNTEVDPAAEFLAQQQNEIAGKFRVNFLVFVEQTVSNV